MSHYPEDALIFLLAGLKGLETQCTFLCSIEQEKAHKPSSQPPNLSKKEKNKVPTAFILLNTEIGAENQVLKNLKGIEGVEQVYNLWGVYDIIAHVKADNLDKLKSIITDQIEKIGKINSKLTMIITEQKPHIITNQLVFGPDQIVQTA